MRRSHSRRLRLTDLPRLALQVLLELAGLFGGRYRRTEGAHTLVRDEQGRILVVRTTYLGPGWMLPGGRVERSESPHAAAVRETREETGIEVRVERLILVDAHRRRNVSFVYAATAIGGQLAPQFGEIAEVGWLARDEIAATSWRLNRLLTYLDAAEGGVAYIGLPHEAA
ncbi:MAG: NUDIX hydrolase [Chloroflexota bacterium]|jgi:ADP-ribose pyrophosphatase YjhB (NUDIX family)|nr:NUDIX hydrolase [Chloroflexota bacterium]